MWHLHHTDARNGKNRSRDGELVRIMLIRRLMSRCLPGGHRRRHRMAPMSGGPCRPCRSRQPANAARRNPRMRMLCCLYVALSPPQIGRLLRLTVVYPHWQGSLTSLVGRFNIGGGASSKSPGAGSGTCGCVTSFPVAAWPGNAPAAAPDESSRHAGSTGGPPRWRVARRPVNMREVA